MWGGGVAAIEALLGLRAQLGLAPHIDLIAPNRRFVYEPLSVAEPFGLAETRRSGLAAVAGECGAQLHVASLERVEPERRRITISGGTKLVYDRLIVAVGARRCEWLPGALDFTGSADVASFRELLAYVERSEVLRLVFTMPPGTGWTLPCYELALPSASWIAERHITESKLTIVTPEPEPLARFGPTASRAMREVLADRGIRLYPNVTAAHVTPNSLQRTSGRSIEIDQVVALPKLEGPRLAGLPADDAGFTPTDEHAQVNGLDDVHAAGDAAAFAVKQGGIAAQQADAAVEAIAASFGAARQRSAFQPVLRGMLLTGVAPTYLRAAVADDRASRAPTRCGGRRPRSPDATSGPTSPKPQPTETPPISKTITYAATIRERSRLATAQRASSRSASRLPTPKARTIARRSDRLRSSSNWMEPCRQASLKSAPNGASALPDEAHELLRRPLVPYATATRRGPRAHQRRFRDTPGSRSR